MPHWLSATAGAAGGTVGALLLIVGIVVAATVVLGVASVALSADRRSHALDVGPFCFSRNSISAVDSPARCGDACQRQDTLDPAVCGICQQHDRR